MPSSVILITNEFQSMQFEFIGFVHSEDWEWRTCRVHRPSQELLPRRMYIAGWKTQIKRKGQNIEVQAWVYKQSNDEVYAICRLPIPPVLEPNTLVTHYNLIHQWAHHTGERNVRVERKHQHCQVDCKITNSSISPNGYRQRRYWVDKFLLKVIIENKILCWVHNFILQIILNFLRTGWRNIEVSRTVSSRGSWGWGVLSPWTTYRLYWSHTEELLYYFLKDNVTLVELMSTQSGDEHLDPCMFKYSITTNKSIAGKHNGNAQVLLALLHTVAWGWSLQKPFHHTGSSGGQCLLGREWCMGTVHRQWIYTVMLNYCCISLCA